MEQPAQLGKYRLLRRLAVGGMAEVFLGRAAGPAGFSKLAAIKRIHLHLADHPDFVDMFLDEARLASGLDHPNIVQIIDLGRVDDHYFLAMEYVHGKTVRDLLNRANEYGQLLPLDAVFTIARGVLSALNFAHNRRAGGKPAPVVHRDVSPQNILVSYSGNAKLADFGIAKAQDRVSVTQDGVVKGKAYYMAPEQMFEGKVDHRVDIYAFGVVLHELLTGRRLFGQYSQSQLFNPKLRKEVPAPSQVVPARPATLDNLVLRLLSRNPDGRFQSCAEVIAALEELMLGTQLIASSERLGSTMRMLFAVEREEEDRQLADAAERMDASAPTAETTAPNARMSPETGETLTSPRVTGDGAPNAEKAPPQKTPQKTPQTSQTLQDFPTLIKDASIGASTGSLAVTRPAHGIPEEAPTNVLTPVSGSMVQPVAVTTVQPPRRPPWAAIAVGVGLGLLAAAIGLQAILSIRGDSQAKDAGVRVAAARHDIERPAPDIAPVVPTAEQPRDASTSPEAGERVRLRIKSVAAKGTRRARPAGRRTGTLELTSEPAGTVHLGGRNLGITPLRGVRLPAGTHNLLLRSKSLGLSHRFTVTIAAGQSTRQRIRVGTGTLRVNAIPWARVYLDGRMLDVTPIKPIKLYPGVHVVELVFPGPSGKQRHKVRVRVRSGGTHKVIHNFLHKGAP